MQSHMKEVQYLMLVAPVGQWLCRWHAVALCTSNALHPVVWPDKFHLHRPHAVEAYMVEHAVGIAANQCELKLLLVECDSWLLCMRGRGRQG